MKIFSQLSNRKLTTNNITAENSAKIRPRKKPISLSSINKNNEKEKDKRDSNSIIKLFKPKNIFNRKGDEGKINKVPPRHSFWKNINRSTEKKK